MTTMCSELSVGTPEEVEILCAIHQTTGNLPGTVAFQRVLGHPGECACI